MNQEKNLPTDLIFTSQVNHLRTAQFIVAEYGLTRVRLIHLHSEKVPLPDGWLSEYVDCERFVSCEFLAIPHGSSIPNIFKLHKINAIYAAILQKYRPKRVFLFCQDRTYNVLIKQARAVGAELNYIEEGLGTYAEKNLFSHTITFDKKRMLKNFYKIFVIDYLVAYAMHMYKFIVKILLFPYATYIMFKRLLSLPDVHIAIMRLTRVYSEIFDLYPKFDRALVAFPKTAAQYVNAEKYEKIDILKCKTNLKKDLQYKLPASSNPILFVSQKYSTPKTAQIYYSCLFSLLGKVVTENNVSIDIKLHPREDRAFVQGYLKKLKNSKFHLLPVSNFSAEHLIIHGSNYKIILGICSSTMLYVAALRPHITVYSIGAQFIASLTENKFPAGLLQPIQVGVAEMAKIQAIPEYTKESFAAHMPVLREANKQSLLLSGLTARVYRRPAKSKPLIRNPIKYQI